MTAERWQEIERVFHLAGELPPNERRAYVARVSDDDVRREVLSLLEAEARAASSGDWSAASVAADWAASRRTQNLVGKRLDGYTIRRLLGTGGMGETYLAADAALGRQAALKFLLPEAGRDHARVRRFLDEARAASALNHPGIVTVYGLGQFDGQHYLATEYIEGETLRCKIARGPLPAAEALEIALQMLAALAAAHAAGLVHRDIKPENVMLRRDGYLKIIDFGLAKLASPSGVRRPALTRAGAVVGTLDYMAPEQAAGGAVDARADLYSFSVVLYEMLTGELPRELGSGSRPSGSGRRRIPAGLLRLVRKGVATDPARRWQSAAELQRELRALQPKVQRRPALRSAAAALACVAIAALGFGVYRWRAAAAAPASTSLIVMPLTALGSADAAHLEDGMSNAIITRLSGIASLRVLPSAALRPNEDPFEAAHRLGVTEVLTGTVQRQANRLRVTAQLTRAADRRVVWAQQFDENFTNIFAIQDAIAQDVAGNLVTQLSPGDRARLTRHEATNTDAYDLYLRARDQWALRSAPSIHSAIAMYQQAIAIEPDFALAYAGLADCYNLAVSGMAPLEREPLARAAAERAIALDPNSAEAHTALAFLDYKFDWKWADADAEFRRALALDPNDELAHHWYGEMLHLQLRNDDAIRQFQLAVALDPYTLPVRYDFVHAYLNAGRVADARAAVEAMRPLGPDSGQVLEADSEVLLAEGHVAQSVAQYLRFEEVSAMNEAEIARQRAAFQSGGLPAFYRARLLPLLAAYHASPATPFLSTQLADLYAHLQDRTDTLTWLTQAVNLHEDEALLMKGPVFDFLRHDPAFIALEKRVGLG